MKRLCDFELKNNSKKWRPTIITSSISNSSSPDPATFFCHSSRQSECVCNEKDPTPHSSFLKWWRHPRNQILTLDECSWSTSSEENSSDTPSSLGPDNDEDSTHITRQLLKKKMSEFMETE